MGRINRVEAMPEDCTAKVEIQHVALCAVSCGAECDCSPSVHVSTRGGEVTILPNGDLMKGRRAASVIDAEIIRG